jgi:hypothetical protein
MKTVAHLDYVKQDTQNHLNEIKSINLDNLISKFNLKKNNNKFSLLPIKSLNES